jgi:hypothetical protein
MVDALLCRSCERVKFGERILRNALADNDDDSSQSDRQSIANRLLCFRQPSCLDAQAKKNEEIILEFYGTRRCCLTVYVLGDHLDRTQVSVFHIVWTLDSATVECLRMKNCGGWVCVRESNGRVRTSSRNIDDK